ncbi:glycerophosphodiester phosphodiesterase [Gallaecimonas xiamenensis]|uniref:Glycerophosphoryl diester phosphodiesterase n=1 Tax=Gallaecimonas xiamenensis 3-C-1 TaxID=745411 RepID=K2JRA0_9GAMM|nr:glycerophosphodiester phosphodiesterase [Gallaecimonas xiamenensis]EKE77903.1 glycerophosphoryl diester phosphodiesterase [Gallaecimonas xiamenensis 3-C-1]
MRLSTLLPALICLGLLGCQQRPQQSQPAPPSPERQALSQALAARGFMLTGLNNINYLGARQCAGLTLEAHRGSVRYPENSVNALIDALDNGFDVIETDVRLTGDDVWVIHHDARTGRATGTVDNQRRRIESMSYKKEWGYLRERDMASGALIDQLPPSFEEYAKTFARFASGGQKINIEVKTPASPQDLKILDYLAHTLIGQGRYYYSSLELRNLERLRDINDEVFLSFIQSPAKTSLNRLAADMKKGAGGDPIYLRNQSLLEDLQGYGNKRYKDKRYDSAAGLARLKKALKHDFGLALDIRHFRQSAIELMSAARRQGVQVATYTVNGHPYHEQGILALAAGRRPDAVIIDDSVYGFCSRFGVPSPRAFAGSTPQSRQLAALPRDLDLERLDLLDTYYPNGLYPAIGGSLKSFRGEQAPPFKPVLMDTHAGPREKDTGVDLHTQGAISIELRKQN